MVHYKCAVAPPLDSPEVAVLNPLKQILWYIFRYLYSTFLLRQKTRFFWQNSGIFKNKLFTFSKIVHLRNWNNFLFFSNFWILFKIFDFSKKPKKQDLIIIINLKSFRFYRYLVLKILWFSRLQWNRKSNTKSYCWYISLCNSHSAEVPKSDLITNFIPHWNPIFKLQNYLLLPSICQSIIFLLVDGNWLKESTDFVLYIGNLMMPKCSKVQWLENFLCFQNIFLLNHYVVFFRHGLDCQFLLVTSLWKLKLWILFPAYESLFFH